MIKILLVDEEPEILSIAEIYLAKFGDYDIRTSTSAKEALKLLEEEEFDAIISDYEMPEMDGLEFLRVIRDKKSLIPFVLFSGKAREEIIIEAFRSGADGVVQKGQNPAANYAELSHQVKISVYRRKAEMELRTKEYAIEHSINGVSIIEYETGKITYANESALRILGYSRNDLSSMSIMDFLAGGDNKDLKKKILDTVAEKGYYIGRVRVKRKDGADMDLSVSVTTLPPDDLVKKKLVFVSFIDITDVIKSEEEFLEFILETSRRIKEPVSLVGQSLESLVNDVVGGTDPETMKLRLLVLIKNIRQIVCNVNELNKAVAGDDGKISEDNLDFLFKI